MLKLRAALLAQTRTFFVARGLLEVDTPVLVRHAVTDRHIQCASVTLPGHASTLYLHSSPEYAMKRLLAAGSGDIFQIAHVVRGEESSPLHNAEFTLIEWYRGGYSMQQLMDEVAELTRELLALPSGSAIDQIGYQQLFERELGIDPLGIDEPALRTLAMQHGLGSVAADCDRDALLDWLMAAVLGPSLGRQRPCFLHHYPASQAALARLDAADARVALRFELYYRGVELANGFEELADESLQRGRFAQDLALRRRDGLPLPEVDGELLAALAQGLPPCSGVALGFDRALMLRAGARSISEVLSFPLERA